MTDLLELAKGSDELAANEIVSVYDLLLSHRSLYPKTIESVSNWTKCDSKAANSYTDSNDTPLTRLKGYRFGLNQHSIRLRFNIHQSFDKLNIY